MIILIGPSASGKTEVAKKLCQNYGYKKFVTTTTRQIRVHEIDKVDYNFISKKDFLNKINNDEFIEYVQYNGNFYGTEKRLISNNTVLIIEPTGLKYFINLNDPSIISFFLDSSSEIRKERMISRGDKKEDIIKRLSNDDEIFSNEVKKMCTYVLDSTKYTLDELASYIDNLYINIINK